MNLAKLFVILGIVLITTLGETEGRRRWFKRKYKTIGCAGRQQFNSAIGDLTNDHQDVNTDVAVPHNATARNHRRSNKWRKLKCGGHKCADRISATNMNDNSSDTEINTNSVRRKSKNNRRVQCNQPRNWRFHRVTSVSRLNATHSDVPVSHNPDEHNRRRNRNGKCKGGRARKGKCLTPVPRDGQSIEEEWTDTEPSIENELHIGLATTEEPIEIRIH